MTMTVLSAYTGRAKGKFGYYNIRKDEVFLTKTLHATTKAHAKNLSLYRLGDFYNPQSLEELHPLLLEWESDPHSMIIRYKYIQKYDKGDLVPRTSDAVISVPSPIIALDIDSLEFPPNVKKDDISAQAEYAISLLHKCAPNIFPDDLGYIAQGSSSAGMSDCIKLHLWIENYSKLNQAQLKVFFNSINTIFKDKFCKEYPLVDMLLYSARQPHYVATPRFIGIEDPLKGVDRMVYSYGSQSHISNDIIFTEDIQVSEKEREDYLSRIEGSELPSAALEERISKLRSWDPKIPGVRTAVQSVYHRAVQECYNLEKLGIELLNIIRVLRPGEEHNYISQGRQVAINQIFKNAKREMPDKVLDIEVKSKQTPEGFYLHLDSMPDDGSAVFLKASLGTGKTHTVEQLLKEYNGTFLSITNTVALVESNAERFNAGVYNKSSDLLDLASGELKRICSTIHSLHKLKDYKFDFIFIDECDAVMQDLLSASIISESKRIMLKDTLADLLIRSKVIIFSDGDISKETMEAYTSLMEGQKDIIKVSHHRENLKDGIAYKHKSIESMLGALEGELSINNKCILVTDLSPEKLNSYMLTFKRIMPEKVGVVMHANSKLDEEFRDIVNNTTKALKNRKVDYLFCSPSITNGVDFNYFDTIFVITTTTNHSPNLRFQALKRERKSNRIHFYLPHLKGYTSGYALLPESPVWLDNCRRLYALRKERECEQYLNTFNHYLISSGCRIEVVDDPYQSPQDTEDKKLALLERATAIFEGKIVPRHNDAPEMLKLVKHFLGEDVGIVEIADFIKNRVFEKADLLYKVIDSFWPVLKHADPELLLETLKTEKGSLFNFQTGISVPKPELRRSTKIKICADILKRCGIESKETVPTAVDNYIKYCTFKELPILEELMESEEAVYDLI